MKVKMLKNTYDASIGYLRQNRVVETDQTTAERWIRRHIATEVIDNGGQTESTNPEGYEAEKEPSASVDIPNETTAPKAEEKPLTYDDYVKANKKVKPADYSEMTKQELINEAVRQGVDVKSNMTKVELIEKLIGG